MAGREIVYELIADASQFASGSRAAAKAANELFVGTRTNLERFQMELSKVQNLKDIGAITADTAKRAQSQLVEKFDPFGTVADRNARQKADAQAVADAKARTAEIIASERQAAETRINEEKRVATTKEEWMRQHLEKMRAMDYAYEKQISQGRARQLASSIKDNQGVEKELAATTAQKKARTAEIINSERSYAMNARQNFLSMLDQDLIDSRMDKIAKRTRSKAEENRSSGGRSMRANMAIQQLAFGLEDASSQYGTMGITGAIRGASNNISAAAMMLGPQAAVFGALASTVAMLGSQYFSASQNAEKLAKSQDLLAESANRLNRELDEREKNYALRFQLEDIGEMSHQSAAAERRKSERQAETQEIRKQGVELSVMQTLRKKINEEQARIARQQKEEGFDQGRYNRNLDLERMRQMNASEVMSLHTDQLPTGFMNDNEIETLKQKQEEYRRLTVEIGNANEARKRAYEIEQRESKRAFEEKQSDNQWNQDQKDWDAAGQSISKTEGLAAKYLRKRQELWDAHQKGFMTREEYQSGLGETGREMFGDTRSQARKYQDHVSELNKLTDDQMTKANKSIYQKQLVKDYFGDLRRPAEQYAEQINGIKTLEKNSEITAEQSARIRRKAFESTFGDLRTPMQKYREQMEDLQKVEKEGGLTAAESYKLRRRAAADIVPQKLLSGAVDINSAEGATAMGSAYEQAMRQSMIMSFAGNPSKPDDPQKQVAANTQKGTELLGKIANTLSKQPGLSVEMVGLS